MILQRKEEGKVNMFTRDYLKYWGYSVCLEILFAYDESSRIHWLKRGTSMADVSFQRRLEK